MSEHTHDLRIDPKAGAYYCLHSFCCYELSMDDMLDERNELAEQVASLRRLLQSVYDEAGFEDGIWAEVKLALEGSKDG